MAGARASGMHARVRMEGGALAWGAHATVRTLTRHPRAGGEMHGRIEGQSGEMRG